MWLPPRTLTFSVSVAGGRSRRHARAFGRELGFHERHVLDHSCEPVTSTGARSELCVCGDPADGRRGSGGRGRRSTARGGGGGCVR